MSTFYDRVWCSVANSTANSITFGTALTGYQTPVSAGVSNGATVSYELNDANAWESGRGTFTANTVSRTLIQSSTGSLLSLSNTATVFLTLLGSDANAFANAALVNNSISAVNNAVLTANALAANAYTLASNAYTLASAPPVSVPADASFTAYSESSNGAVTYANVTTVTLDFEYYTVFGPVNAGQHLTFATANATLTARTRSAVLYLIANGHTITWPTGWKWSGGLAPTLSANASVTDAIYLVGTNGSVFASAALGFA